MAKQLITYIVKQLVTKPDAVTVTEVAADNNKHLVQVCVAPQDLARIIGGEGRLFRALQTIVRLANTHQETDLVVDTAE